MSFEVEIDVKGLEEAARRIRSVLHALESEDVEKVLLKGANIVGRAVRTNIRTMTKRHTGRLLSSVKVSKGKRRGRLFATAFAAMDRKKAPHSHLVEYGHQVVRNGQVVGHAAPRPFFRAAVDQTRAEVGRIVNEGIAQLIERAARS